MSLMFHDDCLNWLDKQPEASFEAIITDPPSLKPQRFMRRIVYASLPLGEGRILDPFMGGGSTLAAADNVGYDSVGVEIDKMYYDLAVVGIPLLATLYPFEVQAEAAPEPAKYASEPLERPSQAMLFS